MNAGLPITGTDSMTGSATASTFSFYSMLWPLAVLFATGTAFVLYWMVAPQFADLYDSVGLELPRLTEWAVYRRDMVWPLLYLLFGVQDALLLVCLIKKACKGSPWRRAFWLASGVNFVFAASLWCSFYWPILLIG